MVKSAYGYTKRSSSKGAKITPHLRASHEENSAFNIDNYHNRLAAVNHFAATGVNTLESCEEGTCHTCLHPNTVNYESTADCTAEEPVRVNAICEEVEIVAKVVHVENEAPKYDA